MPIELNAPDVYHAWRRVHFSPPGSAPAGAIVDAELTRYDEVQTSRSPESLGSSQSGAQGITYELNTSLHQARRVSGQFASVILGGYSNQSQMTTPEHRQVLAGPVWDQPESPHSTPEARSESAVCSRRMDRMRNGTISARWIATDRRLPARSMVYGSDGQERLALQPPSTPRYQLSSQRRLPKTARRRRARRSSKRSTAHRIAAHGPQPRHWRSPAVGRERLYPNREAKQVNTTSNSSVLSLGGDFDWTAFIFPHSSLSGKSNEAFTESGVSPRTRSRLDVGRPDRGSLAGKVASMITIELFGVPLLRAGRGSVALEAPTLKRCSTSGAGSARDSTAR